jgi:hypothetical protein
MPKILKKNQQTYDILYFILDFVYPDFYFLKIGTAMLKKIILLPVIMMLQTCRETAKEHKFDVFDIPLPDFSETGSELFQEQAEDTAEQKEQCPAGNPCDDHNGCTVDDRCGENGKCEGTIAAGCDDNLDCTEDRCKTKDSCTHELKPGHCLINGICYEDGAVSPENPCYACISAVSTSEFIPENLRKCDDKNECSQNDFCWDGKCIAGHESCSDGDMCTIDFCDTSGCKPEDKNCKGTKCIHEDLPLSMCDDKNPCTDDECDSSKGCIHISRTGQCEDGNLCTIDEICKNDKCIAGGFKDCSDSIGCTFDSCVPSKGCIHVPIMSECDDNNACTLDSCDPSSAGNASGCMNIPLADKKCDDENACTTDDFCSSKGVCTGKTTMICDDANPCTADSCNKATGECEYETVQNGKNCSTGNQCIINGECQNGICEGQGKNCSDSNSCTSDTCDQATGNCIHVNNGTVSCVPKITVSSPLRGATLNGNKNISVSGSVSSPAGDLKFLKLTLNGQIFNLSPEKNFSKIMTAVQGMNTIIIDAEDEFKGTAHAVRTFYYSTEWHTVDNSSPDKSLIDNGMMLFIGKDAWDDNNTNTLDDIASILTLFLKNYDFASVLPYYIADGSSVGCSYKVHVKKITYSTPYIDLAPSAGTLNLHAVINNFRADFYAEIGWCFGNIDGYFTVDSAIIDTSMNISVDSSGNPKVSIPGNVFVMLNNPAIHDTGLDWLANLLIDIFQSEIEDTLSSTIKEEIPPKIENVLKSFAVSASFITPKPYSWMPSVTLNLSSKLSGILLDASGSRLGMKAAVTSAKKNSHNPLGSIGRANCLSSGSAFDLPEKNSLEAGLFDDFLNEITFSIYWGGMLNFTISKDDISQIKPVDFSQFGVDDVNITADFLLPPIITGCGVPDNGLRLQAGDISLLAKVKFTGASGWAAVQIYASAMLDAFILLSNTADGAVFSLHLGDVKFIDLEIESIEGDMIGGPAVINTLLKDKLIPELLKAIANKTFGNFPLPEIDLHSIYPEGFPPGKKLILNPEEILRISGYTVLTGDFSKE